MKVYEVRPPGALPLPCVTLTLEHTAIDGGFPVTMQQFIVNLQVDVWCRTETEMRQFGDKVIMKLLENRTEMGFIDIVLRGGKDVPEEKIWRRYLYYQVETTIKKS